VFDLSSHSSSSAFEPLNLPVPLILHPRSSTVLCRTEALPHPFGLVVVPYLARLTMTFVILFFRFFCCWPVAFVTHRIDLVLSSGPGFCGTIVFEFRPSLFEEIAFLPGFLSCPAFLLLRTVTSSEIDGFLVTTCFSEMFTLSVRIALLPFLFPGRLLHCPSPHPHPL